MNILKKSYRFLLAILLVAAIAFSVTACKKDTTSEKGNQEETNNPTDPSNPTDPTNPAKPDPSVKYTVKFENVDKAAYPDMQINKNGTVSVAPPQRSDATFLGWYIDRECEASPFVMGSSLITSDTTLYAKWKNSSAGETDRIYTVTFNSDGGTAVAAQSVKEGKCAFKPNDPQKAGHQFLGWYNGNVKFDLSANVITSDITLIAKWQVLDAKIVAQGAYNESLYVEWKEGAPASASVEYSPAGANSWTQVDKQLIRAKDSSTARVDVLGITAGEYDVKINPSDGSSLTVSNISVAAYDRSGYAHFKYTEGIGAYKDDGTLKDNAIVIYVTDENKDTVMDEICAEYSGVNMFTVPGTDWNGKNASGIGWWLNNAQYTKTDSKGNKGNTWTENGNSLGFKSVDRPIAIRFIGEVTTPEGCTAFNSLNEGGSVGDNGHMARMRNLKNVTIEGVGEDATILGWGFHFMTGSDAVNGQGKSFELRNLTFDKYPEDAIGMEGVQEGGKITGSVERCWVHHNTFMPGFGNIGPDGKPAESDKAEGDGSCDFKRGQYFTCSYNYFTDCHKTNLVGSSDSSLQYDITYHHNWWHNCGSRIPLSRQANIHFYNNYVSTDTTGANISYVHSIRANAYIFSEANYYLGCKNIADDKAKGWNNTYLGCFGNNLMVDVKTRDEKVPNACKHFNGTDLSSFDTDPALFYYNAQTKQSDCLLDDSVTARAKAVQYAGCNGWGKNNPDKGANASGAVKELMNDQTPSEAVPVPDEGTLTVDFKAPPKGVILDGAVSSGALKSTKGKGQFVIFRLAAPAKVTVGGVSDNYGGPYLISQNGTVIAQLSATVSTELEAGIYMICVGCYSYDLKQSSISSLSFESTANSSKAKLEALNNAINAIGSVNLSSEAAINEALVLLNALKAEEVTAFDAAYPGQRDRLTAAQATYNRLCVENAEALINAIGTVGENSYPAIKAARDAYDALPSALQAQVSNYTALTSAEADWANVAAIAVNNNIAALTDVSGWTVANGKAAITAQITAYGNVKSSYEALTPAQQATVTNYAKVTGGLTKLNALLAEITAAEQQAANLADFNAKLDALTADTVTLESGAALKAAYERLTPAQQAGIDAAKYEAVMAKYTELANQAVVAIFTKNDPSLATNAGFTVNGKYNGKGSFEYNGTTYSSPLKLESSTSVTFTTSATNKMVIKIGTAGGQLKVDGTVYKDTDNDGFIIIDGLAAGNHSITKASGDPNLCYIELAPAN